MKRYHAILGLCLLPVLALLAPQSAVPPPSPVPATPPKYVALTFDDGPNSVTTARLLDGLGERGVRATFFLIGEQIKGNEELIRRMGEAGHQIGNHTYTHIRLDRTGDAGVQEVRRTEGILRDLLGEKTYWLRPPWGYIDAATAERVGVPLIYWTVDPEDWRDKNADIVTERILRDTKAGDVILMHDIYGSSVDAALRVVDALQAQGYTFVTVEELFALQGVEVRPGVLYTRVGK